MADKLTIEQRHYNMSRIRAKDTKPEIIVRKYLWSHGFRYRLNHPRLPGKPDIVLRKYRTCIFVNGCFWHGHNLRYENKNKNLWYEDEDLRYENKNKNLRYENANANENESFLESSECCKIPKTNREFWVRKIMRNRERDVDVKKKLASMGWHYLTIWECELKPLRRSSTLESLVYTLNKIFLMDRLVKKYSLAEEDAPMMVAEDVENEYGRE